MGLPPQQCHRSELGSVSLSRGPTGPGPPRVDWRTQQPLGKELFHQKESCCVKIWSRFSRSVCQRREGHYPKNITVPITQSVPRPSPCRLESWSDGTTIIEGSGRRGRRGRSEEGRLRPSLLTFWLVYFLYCILEEMPHYPLLLPYDDFIATISRILKVLRFLLRLWCFT